MLYEMTFRSFTGHWDDLYTENEYALCATSYWEWYEKLDCADYRLTEMGVPAYLRSYYSLSMWQYAAWRVQQLGKLDTKFCTDEVVKYIAYINEVLLPDSVKRTKYVLLHFSFLQSSTGRAA